MNDLKCLFLGKCVRKEYEYFFEFDGETLQADKCISNLKGYTSCEYQGKTFENVSYYSRLIKEEPYQNDELIFGPLLLFALCLLLIPLSFKVLY